MSVKTAFQQRFLHTELHNLYSMIQIELEMDPTGQTVRRTKILITPYVLELLILV